ncbi:MFS transporter [Neisseriaceae bacterium JH1-16]|nr:MFS transporter [Neisseriaceae bacterium JH1-16]
MTPTPHHLSRPLVLLFAIACGTIIASLYYSQPLLATIAASFGRQPASVGYLVTLTQIGYAIGLVLVVPLGDALDRRRLIVGLLAASVGALLIAAFSPGFSAFAAASVLVGMTSCSAQLLVPFAASLSDERQRGRVVGTVMSGLLLGILLARTVSGLIAELAGWRAVYIAAAVLVALLTLGLARALPRDQRDIPFQYGALLKSLGTLIRTESALRERSLYGALAFACFSVFWTGLTFLLSQPPYGFSEGEIGAFGLAGAAGALSAGFAGRLADRGRGGVATVLCSGAILLSFAFIALGAHSLVALLVGVLLLDIGVQGLHISNQSVIYTLAPEMRSRITTVYLTSYFIGGAAGSSAASVAYAAAGWYGVCLAGAGFAGLLCVWQLARAPRRRLAEQRG